MRTSAKELTSLILDEERLRAERSDRRAWKSRVRGLDDEMAGFEGGPELDDRQWRRPDRPRGDDEDVEYRLAIEASKAEAEEERRRRQKQTVTETDDDDLAKAIKLSKEEEELRRRELEESNAASLFDDTPAPTQPAQPQPTGWNQGYQQQPAVDWFGNPVDQQQPMTTGFLNQQYAQPTGMSAQPTAQQNGYGYGYQQSQPTGYDQFGQPMQGYLQPQATAMQMQHTIQPQQTAFQNNNPYSTFGQQQTMQQQQVPQNNFLSPGNNNPWAQRPQSADAIKPQPTGSNNPFSLHRQNNNAPRNTGPSTLNTLAEQRAATQFTNQTTNNPIMNYQAPSTQQSQQQQQQQQYQQPQNPHHARLNALLAEGDGQDTFGNVGDLRIPAQHTAPGVFVNSAGHGMDKRLEQAQTGQNPFMGNQFTGLPPLQSTATGFGMQQQNNNPFGQQMQPGWGAQPQRSQQQGGSLIDL